MPVRHWNHRDQTEPGLWNKVVLAGKLLPGFAHVRVKLPSGIKRRKATGKRGAGLKDVGSDPREVSIRLLLETPEDLILADDARDLIVGKANGDPMDPLTILNELTNYFNIGAVVLGDVDIEEPDAVNGWEWNIQAFEWLPESELSKNVKDQQKKPKDDVSAWLPFRDDGVAGSAAPPSEAAAHDNLPNPRG
jgi:hypothetical protein